MKRQWYYRGSLKSCNYQCSYCPFSKRRGNERECRADQEDWFRFVDRINSLDDAGGAILVIPYGEALIHPYYWEGLARLSQNSNFDAVGAQSNFSFCIEQMISLYCTSGGDLKKLRLWGTFHPEMTTIQQFVKQCERLSARHISYCVGAVGMPEQIERIRSLRRELPSSVYLWINKMDGLGRAYHVSEIESFLEIDPYFERELTIKKADAALCGNQLLIEADGTMRRCNLCRQSLGNFYEDAPIDNKPGVGLSAMMEPKQTKGSWPACTRKKCSCYLAYCNRTEESFLFFLPYPAFRIPFYKSAMFIDIDGTLIPEGETRIPEKYQKWMMQLKRRCDIYLVTSLPFEIARKKAASVWQALCGGIFANGGRWMIFKGFRLDVAERMETGWVAQAAKRQSKYGFSLRSYRKGNDIYKVTLAFRKRRLPEKSAKEYLDKIRMDLQIPKTCQLIWEENCIQVTKRGTGKLEGILKICERKGYAREDVCVIGNSENDIPMLTYFPFSVAAKGSGQKVRECAAVAL